MPSNLNSFDNFVLSFIFSLVYYIFDCFPGILNIFLELLELFIIVHCFCLSNISLQYLFRLVFNVSYGGEVCSLLRIIKCSLSLNSIEFKIPWVIHFSFLCLCLLNFTSLTWRCFSLAAVIMLFSIL